MKYCPYCEMELNDNKDICPHCEKKLEAGRQLFGKPRSFWLSIAGVVGIVVTMLLNWVELVGFYNFNLFTFWAISGELNWFFTYNRSIYYGMLVTVIVLIVLFAVSIISLLLSIVKFKTNKRNKYAFIGFGLSALIPIIFIFSMLGNVQNLDNSYFTALPLITFAFSVLALIFAVDMEVVIPSRAYKVLKYIWTEHSIIFVTVLIFVAAGTLAPRFLAVNNLFVVLRQSSIIGMIALGMTFVIITGGIDLSAGHTLTAAGAVLIMLQANADLPLVVPILASFAIATAFGFVIGKFITVFKLPPFIVTLAIGIMARSIALELVGGVTIIGRRVPEFTNIGTGAIGLIPNALIIWVVSAVILGCVLAYTKFGSFVYAIGGNEMAARYTGIPVEKTKVMAYTLAGLCVGVATLLDFSRMAAISVPVAGYLYEFDAITAVIIGGTSLAGGRGKMLNTMFGVVLVCAVSNLMIMLGISSFLAGFVKGLIIITAVMIQRRPT